MKKSTTKKGAPESVLNETHVREVVDQMLREALRSFSRDMEGHLKDIDARIKNLETRPR